MTDSFGKFVGREASVTGSWNIPPVSPMCGLCDRAVDVFQILAYQGGSKKHPEVCQLGLKALLMPCFCHSLCPVADKFNLQSRLAAFIEGCPNVNIIDEMFLI